MGLVLKEKKATERQFNINSNYKARYVELAKPMTGIIALAIYHMLEDMDGDPGMKLNLSNTIATFVCWMLGEQLIHRICIHFDLYTKPDSKNPLYRNLKTLASLGSSLGVIFASLSSTLSNRKLSASLYSMLMGSMIGLFALIIHQCDAFFVKNEANVDAQVGTEGWSKYSKTALVLGASMGQFLGGINSYLEDSDTLTSLNNITLYSAIASVTTFLVVVACVPLINYLTRDKNEKMSRGILVSDDRALFNNNYVRSGFTLGAAMGTILGALLGPVLIPGLRIDVAITLGASALSVVLGVGFGFLGQKISSYFETHWGVSSTTDNSWSYAARSTANFFSYIGIALAYTFFPGATLMHAAIIGSAMGSLIGWFAGLFIMCLARKIEPDEAKMNATTLPWTQRIAIGTTRGTIIGAVAGLALGFVVGGPYTLIGWSIFLGTLGGIIGGINDIISDPVFNKSVDKAKSLVKKSAPFMFFGANSSPTKEPLAEHSAHPANNLTLFFGEKYPIKQEVNASLVQINIIR
ncbi:hypothetical protein [Legionella saoudiensis]|uniref:hypothetical protein n=1 Tax=Legionella saoudiensis TaxID=1750561 RepID=UPI000730C2DE|nr:hypothetical protein [Legionella saoudiensis]